MLPALISSVVVALVSYVVLAQTGALEVIELITTDPERFETLSEEVLFDLLIDMSTGFVAVAIISVLLYGFLYLVAARAVGQVLSDPPVEASTTSASLRLFLPWLGMAALIYGAVVIGFIFFVIPAVWIAISVSMATPIMGIEEVGPMNAIRRSFSLVKGNWWETFGFLVLVGLIGGTATQFIQLFALPMFLIGTPSVAFGLTIALSLAGQGLIMAAIAVAIAIWYLNLRARAEGPFSLQVS